MLENFRVQLYYLVTLQMLKLNDAEFLGEGSCVLSEVSCLGLSQYLVIIELIFYCMVFCLTHGR